MANAKGRYVPKGRVGAGTRFKQLTEALRKRKIGATARGRKMAKALPGKTQKVREPGALAAWIGRKKYGKAQFQKMAAAGRRAK